jgi:type II secretory pathway component PulJ
MRRDDQGLTLLDVVVALAFFALLVYLVRFDWPHLPPSPPAP